MTSSASQIEIARIESIERGLADPQRFCPVLAAPAWLKGNTLSMQLAGERIELRAPKEFLTKLPDWCRGEMTLAQIEQASVALWGNRQFIQFVGDLVAAGMLIDVSASLLHAMRVSRHPSGMGRPADESVWRNVVCPLPEAQSIGPDAVRLPSAGPSPLSAVIARRESAATFGTLALDRVDLSRLLHAAYGLCRESGRRSVASAGGIYPLTLYVVLLRDVEGLAAGTYRVLFDAQGGVRLQFEHGDQDAVPSLVYHPHMLRHAAGMIVVCGALLPSTLKYANRSYPFAMLEAGQVIQNIALAAAEREIGWRVLGGLNYRGMAAQCRLPEDGEVLIAGVFGSLADAGLATRPSTGEADADHSGIASRIEFLWNDEIPNLPFHLGMARVRSEAGEEAADFSWGRDQNAWRAYDKAVAEAVERHAYRQPRALKTARWDELDETCDPRKVVSYLASQYRDTDFPFKPFDAGTSYLWLEATHLSSGQPVWVPAECVLHRKALPAAYLGQWLTDCSSSGCASGLTIEMTQQAALFEVIERDAFMRHWFAQRGGSEVATHTLPLPFQVRVERLRELGCRVSVQMLQLGVEPVWMVLIQQDDKHFTAVGAAAGLELERALHSALSEAETGAYVRLGGFEAERIHPVDVETPANHADLYAQKRYYKRADALFETHGQIAFGDIVRRHVSDIATVHANLAARGLDPLWIDLTVPGAPRTLTGHALVSGRVLVPGLIPVAFSTLRLPLGMDTHKTRAARFPHPFP